MIYINIPNAAHRIASTLDLISPVSWGWFMIIFTWGGSDHVNIVGLGNGSPISLGGTVAVVKSSGNLTWSSDCDGGFWT